MKHDERDIGLIVDVWSNIKPYLEKKEKEEAESEEELEEEAA